MHRRRVYLEHSSGRKARIEGWLSLSIFVSAAVLFISLLGCWSDVVFWVRTWLLPQRLPVQPGLISRAEASVFAAPCEVLMTLSAAYLFLALFLKCRTRRRTQ